MATVKSGSLKATASVLVTSANLASEVTGILPVVNGGTGQSVYTDGQLLIGNTTGNTLTKATLTAGANVTITNGNGSITIAAASGGITLVTSQATTSGTAWDFTGIPSWVNRITVMLRGFSTNGSSSYIVQLGSGSVATSGYSSSCRSSTATVGFLIVDGPAAVSIANGALTLNRESGNTWVASGNINLNGGATYYSAGTVDLGGTLDRVRLTTVNGTDAGDAGSVSINYE